MKIRLETSNRIYLGHQGDHLLPEIEIDISNLLKQYPNANFGIMVTQPGSTVAYPASTRVNLLQKLLIWTVGQGDVAVSGEGSMQVVVTGNGGSWRSHVISTIIHQSLGANAANVPEAIETWVDSVMDAVGTAQSNMDQLAIDTAAIHQDALNASASATQAAASKTSAETAATAAAASEANVTAMEQTVSDNTTLTTASAAAAKTSENAAKASEQAISVYEVQIHNYGDQATDAATRAAASATQAKASEDNAQVASASANASKVAAQNSASDAAVSENYAGYYADDASDSADRAEATLNAALSTIAEAKGEAIEGVSTALEEAKIVIQNLIPDDVENVQGWLNQEIANRTAADDVLDARITTEKTYLEGRDTAIQDDVTTLSGRVDTVVSNLAAEVTARSNEDTNLQSQINALSSTVGSNATDFSDALDELEETVSNNYDTVTAAVNTEKTARESADSSLQSSISSLSTTLGGRIDTEAANRIAADEELESAISDEATARENADDAILVKMGTVADGHTVMGDLAQEVTDRTEAITQEATDRAAADANLQAAITQEATDRENADTALANRVTTIESNAIYQIYNTSGTSIISQRVGNSVYLDVSSGSSSSAEGSANGIVNVVATLTPGTQEYTDCLGADKLLSAMTLIEANVPPEMQGSDWNVTAGNGKIVIEGTISQSGTAYFTFGYAASDFLDHYEEELTGIKQANANSNAFRTATPKGTRASYAVIEGMSNPDSEYYEPNLDLKSGYMYIASDTNTRYICVKNGQSVSWIPANVLDDIYGKIGQKVSTSDVVDNLTTDDGSKVLSAKQGKVLNGAVNEVKNSLLINPHLNVNGIEGITTYPTTVGNYRVTSQKPEGFPSSADYWGQLHIYGEGYYTHIYRDYKNNVFIGNSENVVQAPSDWKQLALKSDVDKKITKISIISTASTEENLILEIFNLCPKSQTVPFYATWHMHNYFGGTISKTDEEGLGFAVYTFANSGSIRKATISAGTATIIAIT